MDQHLKRILILGPTASGKTELACRLAQELDGEIISVDSRQCYRKINIGTAKPDPEQLQQIPHHNISIFDPDQEDSVADFLQRTREFEEQIRGRGRRIIYAGGSTLHLQSLIEPLDDLPPASSANLNHLAQREQKEGIDALMKQLLEIDPDYAGQIDGMNRHRLFRALDVWLQTGRPFSSFHSRISRDELEPPDDLLVFGLHWPRHILHRRIEERVDRMIDSGLVEETRSLIDEGYTPDQQFLQTVGYRSVISYLQGKLTHQQMSDKIKTSTRRYAKRQLTWFRRWNFIEWLNADEQSVDDLASYVIACLESSPGTSLQTQRKRKPGSS